MAGFVGFFYDSDTLIHLRATVFFTTNTACEM